MAHYLYQGRYSQSAVKAMVEHPHDRAEAVRALLASAGGTLHSLFFCFGDYDVVIHMEMPDNVSAAAISFAVGAAGSISDSKTTVLIPAKDAVGAMEKAKSIRYSPPK